MSQQAFTDGSEMTPSTVTLGDVQFDLVATQDFRLSVEGTSGTGKSNTLAVILEDLANVAIPSLIIERLGALSPVRLEDEDIVVVAALVETFDVDADLAPATEVATVTDDADGDRAHDDAADGSDVQERLAELEAENERLRAQASMEIDESLDAYEGFLGLDAVEEQIEAAKEDATCSPRYIKGVLAGIIAENGPVHYETIAERLGVSTTSDVSKAASELERRRIVTKDRQSDGTYVDLNVDGIEGVRQAAAEREKTEQLMDNL
jgi:vacuolar-type H+-ATPase subunit I/STV1